MNRNYDTTTSMPYTRVDDMRILYGQGTATLQITESESIVLASQIRRLNTQLAVSNFVIDLSTPEALATQIPLVDIPTGAPLGSSTTLGQAIMVITAVIRYHQKQRDASEIAAAPEQAAP